MAKIRSHSALHYEHLPVVQTRFQKLRMLTIDAFVRFAILNR